jgi:hypothetical protein
LALGGRVPDLGEEHCFELRIFNDAQVLGVAVQFGLLVLLVTLAILDEAAEHAHLVGQVLLELEAELFGQAQLAVVVVEALLADAQHPGGLLQVDLLPTVVGLGAVEVQSPPLPHQLDGLGHRPFLAAHVLVVCAVHLEVRFALRTAAGPRLLLLVANQDDGGFKQPSCEETVLCAQYAEGDKGVGGGVVEGDAGHPEGAVLGEDGVEVNGVGLPIDFQINNHRLHAVLLLEHEGLRDLLVRCFYFKH